MPDPAELDRADPLARFRAEFHLPPSQIYLDGNSLGLLSRRAESSLLSALEAWRTLGIDGWTHAPAPWLTLAETAAAKLAPLLNVAPDELCLTGQTTSNLHQLLATLYEPRPAPTTATAGSRDHVAADSNGTCCSQNHPDHAHDHPQAHDHPAAQDHSHPPHHDHPPHHEPTHAAPHVLLGDTLNFASDVYALQSHLRLRGLAPATHLRLIPSRDGRTLRLDDILGALTPDVQLAVLPSVLFTSGQLLDVATLTRKARARGILIGWDLSHSIGAVPHDFSGDSAPDFAFWCHYKWLNAGPGSVGGLYLNRRHHHRAPGLAGWWGVRAERRFAMPREHEAATGARALHIGTPHILSLAPLLGSLELITEAGGIGVLRTKSLALTDLLLALVYEHLAPLGFTVATPRGARARGGHISLAHPEAWRFCQALKEAGVTPDFRAPDLIRLAPSPLYTSFTECAEAIALLKRLALERRHEKFSGAPALVP